MLNRNGFYAEVGRRVYRARRRAGLTQEDLADKVGLARTSITNIEKGRQKLLLHTLAEIALELKVDVGELLPRPRSSPRQPADVERWLTGHSRSERAMAKAVQKLL